MTDDGGLDYPRQHRPERHGHRAARAHIEGVAVTLAVAAVWLVLASANPMTTYHFAPLVATIAAPAFGTYRAGRALGIRSAVVLAVVGAMATSVAAVALAVTGRLAGPTLWGAAGSVGETAAAIGIGLVLGAATAVFPRRPRTRSSAEAEVDVG